MFPIFMSPGTMFLNDMLKTEGDSLDFFVLYSSITSVLGNSGQTVYAAANAFMNSFAHYRTKVLGKPCLSVCWGAMGGAGMLARNTNVAMLLEKSGLHLLDIPTGQCATLEIPVRSCFVTHRAFQLGALTRATLQSQERRLLARTFAVGQ